MAERNPQDAANGSRSMFGRLWRGTKWLAGGPIAAAAPQEIAQGAGFIRRLAAGIASPRSADPLLRVTEDGAIDMEETAMACGVSPDDLEGLFLRRRRETARAAYLAFGLAWLFFLAWFYRTVTMPWTASRVIPILEFIPFCALFFLAAFRAGLENYRLRTRRMATAGDYLLSAEPFWPR